MPSITRFAFVNDDVAWREVGEPNALMGDYGSARLHWPEGSIDLADRVASTVELRMSAKAIAISAPSDDSIPPAVMIVDRHTSALHTISPPASAFFDLAALSDRSMLLM